jgi:hypothetical protein
MMSPAQLTGPYMCITRTAGCKMCGRGSAVVDASMWLFVEWRSGSGGGGRWWSGVVLIDYARGEKRDCGCGILRLH